jgi:hypothetical protein
VAELELLAVDVVPHVEDSVGALRVSARVVVDVDGEPTPVELVAWGWASALTNHYDDDAYAPDVVIGVDADGNDVRDFGRKPGAKPRQLSAAEVGELARRLVREQHPDYFADEGSSSAPATPISFDVMDEHAPIEHAVELEAADTAAEVAEVVAELAAVEAAHDAVEQLADEVEERVDETLEAVEELVEDVVEETQWTRIEAALQAQTATIVSAITAAAGGLELVVGGAGDDPGAGAGDGAGRDRGSGGSARAGRGGGGGVRPARRSAAKRGPSASRRRVRGLRKRR